MDSIIDLARRTRRAVLVVLGWYRSPTGVLALGLLLAGAAIGVVTGNAVIAVVTVGIAFVAVLLPYKLERHRALSIARDDQISSQAAADRQSHQRDIAQTEGALTFQLTRLGESVAQLEANDQQSLLIGEVSSLIDDQAQVRSELGSMTETISSVADASLELRRNHEDAAANAGVRDGAISELKSSAAAREEAISELLSRVGALEEKTAKAVETAAKLRESVAAVEPLAQATAQLVRASTVPLIFSINPGRSGSLYLERLLLSAPGAIGEHEDRPQMIGKYLRLVEDHGTVNTMRERYFKAHAIEAAIANETAIPVSAYVDTSNMFIKTFADVVADYFEHRRVKVLHLRRNLLDTARSFRKLGFFTDTNIPAIDWTFDTRTDYSLASRYRAIESDDPCSLIVGYLVETELRGLEFRANYPRIQVIDVRLEELQDIRAVEALFEQLGMMSDYRLGQVVNRPINAKTEAKTSRDIQVEHDFSTRVLTEVGAYLDAGAPISALLGGVADKEPGQTGAVAEIMRPSQPLRQSGP